VGVRQAVDWYLDRAIQQSEDLILDSKALVSHHQHGLPLKWEGVQWLRAGRLFQPYEFKPFQSEPLEHGREGAMDFDLYGAGGLASDLLHYFGVAATDHPQYATASGRTHNP